MHPLIHQQNVISIPYENSVEDAEKKNAIRKLTNE